MSEKKLTAEGVAMKIGEGNLTVSGCAALIEAYAAQCVKEARERLVAEIKGLAKRIDFEYVLNFKDIDAAKEATE